jgi:hypothetical protein
MGILFHGRHRHRHRHRHMHGVALNVPHARLATNLGSVVDSAVVNVEGAGLEGLAVNVKVAGLKSNSRQVTSRRKNRKEQVEASNGSCTRVRRSMILIAS